MKTWNRTGIIKTVVLAVLAVPNIVAPFPRQPEFNIAFCLLVFLVGGLFMLFVTRYNLFILDQGFTEPEWNDNPFSRTKPLALFQFLSHFFWSTGLALLIGTGINYATVSQIGALCFAFGAGMLLGTYLVARTKRRE